MNNQNTTEGMRKALKAANLIILDPDLQEKLLEEDKVSDEEVLQKLDMPADALSDLREIPRRLKLRENGNDSDTEASNKVPRLTGEQQQNKSEKILWESFDQMRWSFYTAMGMSIVLFLTGLVLLAVAVVEAQGSGGISGAALTTGGLGLGDFVILFFKRPWENIGKNLADSQQIRLIVTSYYASISLLDKKKFDEISHLGKITESSVQLIQRYVESGTIAPAAGSTDAGSLRT